MKVARWVISGFIVVSLLFMVAQLYLLNNKILEQSKILQQPQLEQRSGSFIPILDLGINVGTFPHTNHRGTTAISAMPISSPSSLKGPVIYLLRNGTYPELLFDIYAYNNNYLSVDPVFVTANDSILAFTGDYSDKKHILAKILRITFSGQVTEVYSYDCGAQDPGGYFWGEDAVTGAIWKGHRAEGGIRIIKSIDDGQTWTTKYITRYETPPHVYEVAASDDKVFAALSFPVHTVLYSGDGGDTWDAVLSAGYSIEGISLFGEMMYALTAGEEIWTCSYMQPNRWQQIYLPRGISLMNTTIFRQAKMLGRYIVTCGIAGTDTTTYWATADNFYTISPLFRFGPTNKGANERYSGFGSTIYIGGSRYGDGMVWKGEIPESLTTRIPCLRTILNLDSLAEGKLSSLEECWVFDSRLSPTFTLNVTCKYHASATQGVKIHVISSADGRNFDSVDTYTEIHPFSAGQTIQKTYTFNGAGVIKVQIENLDDLQALTDIRVIGTLGALN